MAVKAISLKHEVTGNVEEFLEQEAMTCDETKIGVVQLINQISTYKEEGKALFPEVYIIDDIKIIEESLANVELIKIDKGLKESGMILKALKKCAPLSIGGWCIYILRNAEEFEYGIFRSGASIVSVPTATSLVEQGDSDRTLMLVRQVGEKIVEVKGVKGNTLIINFGINSTSNISPLQEQDKFIAQVIQSVPGGQEQEQLYTFFKRLFLYVMQNGHGNLCMVLDKDSAYPDILKDGIILEEKLSVLQKLQEFSIAISESSPLHALEANAKLNGIFNVVAGMMMSDGITVFNNEGAVIAYNVFLKHPEDDEELQKAEGGSRSRTFLIMKRNLSETILSVYIQSQDGKTQVNSHERN